MKGEEAAVLMQCHCAGLPGTEDPRISKAVRAAERDPALQEELARQRTFDERHLAAVEQLMMPQALLGKLAAGPAAGGRGLAGKGLLKQPAVLAVLLGAATMLGWGGVMLWNKAHSFTGKDSVMRMVEMNDEMTGMEMEMKTGPAQGLNDWFFDKYGFEDYYVAPQFEKYDAAGARLFKLDDQPVAQVAIPKHNMIFFSFRAEDFGVNLPHDEWRTFTDGDWVAALVQHDDECFMVTMRGSAEAMEELLQQDK